MTEDRGFVTSAEATRDVQAFRQGDLVRPITGRRADKLIRALRDGVKSTRADESDVSPPRVHGYGLTKIETFRAFREIDSQGRLHVIDVIAGEQIDSVLAYEIEAEDTTFVIPGDFPGQIRSDGEIFSGKFKNNGTLIRFFDGTQTAADPDLVSETAWAATGVGKDVSYVYSRWAFINGRFKGDPKVSVYARMGRTTDPRDVNFITEGGKVERLVDWAAITSDAGTAFPIPAGDDRLLVVAITLEDGTFPTIDGCTFGDQSLSFLEPVIIAPGDGFDKSAILYLPEKEIAAATGNLIQQRFSATPVRFTTMAAVYEFVSPESPFVDIDSITDFDSNAADLTIQTAEDGYLIGHYMSGRASDITWDAPLDEQLEVDTASSTASVADYETDGNQVVVGAEADSVDRSLFQAFAIRPNLARVTNAGTFTYDNIPKSFAVNPYRQIFDLLIKPKDIGGKGIVIDKIDVDTFQIMTSWADGVVSVPSFTKTATLTTDSNKNLGTPPLNTNHLLEFDESISPFNYGDVVQVSGSIPSSLSPGVDYHVILVRPAINDFQVPAIALANSVADALIGNSIALGTVTADYQVTKVREVRFMTGFSYEAGDVDGALQRALESCGASLYLNDGKIAITRQMFPATVETVAEDDILGAVALSNRLPPDERATEITGSYTSVLNLFLTKDYPTRDGDGVYQEADAGERRPIRLSLPYIGKASVAQRVATVALRRIRQERIISFPGRLSLIRLRPGTVFSIDKPSLGLDSNTTFEVRDQSIFVEIDEERPNIGIEIVARQLEAETFDLTVSDEEIVESAKITGLQSPFDVPPPGRPEIVETLFQTKAGAGVRARATVTWTASTGAFVKEYRVSYKLSSASAYIFLAPTPDTSLDIDDIAPGTYDFRVEAINSVGALSDPSESAGVVIQGLAAPPQAPQSFFGQLAGVLALLQWDRSTELDVTEGGLVEIRHDTDSAGGNGENAVFLATDVGGKAITQVPFKQGVYYARFQDTSGQWSDFAEWSTEGRRPVPFGQTITSGAFDPNDTTEDQITIQEDPSFPSTDVNNTLIEDTINQRLELPAATTWDDVTDVDAVTNVDEIGADGQVQSEGVYFFSSGIDLNAVTRVRLEAVITTEIVDAADSIDNITDIDSIANIDAIGATAAQAGLATAWIEVRMSRDAAAADTFGQWQRLDSGDFNHRSFEFRVQARSLSPTVNVRITEARIIARELPVNV